MTTMIVWRTRPETHAAAVQKFTAENTLPPAGVEIVSHNHGIGIGFMLVESLEIDPVYAMCSAWAPFVTIEAHPVIDNAAAVAALKAKSN
jgi:hypothetical protein